MKKIMEGIKSFKNMLLDKSVFAKPKTSNSKNAVDFRTEEEYYNYLFTKNDKWNSIAPNNDEQQRWIAIFGHVQFLRGYLQGQNISIDFSILDLGSGRGWLTKLLSGFGNVVGIEPVMPVVKFAQKCHPELTFHSGYLEDHIDLLKERHINLVVSSEVLEHIPNDKQELFAQTISSILQEHGFLIITTPRKEVQKEWMELFGQPGQPIEEWMSADSVKELFERNNFVARNYLPINLPHLKKGGHLFIYQSWAFEKLK